MPRAGTPCTGCGAITGRSVCEQCDAARLRRSRAADPQAHAQRMAKYRGSWPATSRAAIAAHVAAYGWWCPGWRVEPHASDDLTLDHQRGVMCRACNARKRVVDGE
jgi:hypothetical protein